MWNSMRCKFIASINISFDLMMKIMVLWYYYTAKYTDRYQAYFMIPPNG